MINLFRYTYIKIFNIFLTLNDTLNDIFSIKSADPKFYSLNVKVTFNVNRTRGGRPRLPLNVWREHGPLSLIC